MGEWGWVEVYFGWMWVGEQFLWVSGGGWGWVEVYFGWVGVGGGEWSWSLVLV